MGLLALLDPRLWDPRGCPEHEPRDTPGERGGSLKYLVRV